MTNQEEIKVGDDVECRGVSFKVIHIHEDLAWVKSKHSFHGSIVFLIELKKIKISRLKSKKN